MKKLMFILSAVFAAAALQAQNLDPTVEVSRVYEGKLIEVRKPVLEMSVPDTLYKFDLDFDYSVFENPYRGAYEFNPYMMDMRPESNLMHPSKFYLKAGAGYTLHPVFDLLWSPQLKGDFSVDVYGKHRSYVGGYRPIMGHEAFNGYDLLSRAGADFGYDWQKVALDFGASYYGTAVKDFAKSRAYNAVDAYFSVGSKELWSKGFMYNVAMAYRYADEASALPLTEHDMSLDITFGPSFSERDKVFFDMGVELNAYMQTLTWSAARFYLVPHYVYDKGILHMDLGFRLSTASCSESTESDTESVDNKSGMDIKNQIIYPDVHLNLAVIPEAMRLYLNVGGGEKLNSYASLVDRNHHLDLNYGIDNYSALMRPSVERVSAELGFEGRISGFFSYNVRGGYSNHASTPLDAIVANEGGMYMPYIGYSACQNAYATVDWDLNFQDVRFDGTLKYAHYWGMDAPYVFAPAAFTGDAEVVYNWRKRVYAGVDCMFATARTNSEALVIPAYADLGVYAEYVMNNGISFWLRGGNLLNMEIQRTPLFAEKGVNFTGGICLNF